MTNRERVLAAVRHGDLDYTPHNVFFTKQMLNKMVEHTKNAEFINKIGNHISRERISSFRVPIPGREGYAMDEFGVVFDQTGMDKDIGNVIEFQIGSIDELARYDPPPVDEAQLHRQCGLLVSAKGENFSMASLGFSLFERAWTLCGMEDLLCYMMTDAGVVHSLFAKLTERNLKILKIVLEYDIDAVYFGDDWGQQRGLIMGPELWRSMIKPCFARMYGAVRAAGKTVVQHSCGDLREILDDFSEIGMDIYQTFQPEIYDIVKYKEKLRGKLTIWGGISTQAHLPFKTPDEIYEITKNTIEVLGKGGGYIAAPTHDVPGDVPPENIEAMVRAFFDQHPKRFA